MPRLLVIAGPAGSGKTTTAELLARQAQVPHVDFDVATAALVDAHRAAHEELTEGALLARLRSARYALFAHAVAAALVDHDVVIASAPFTSHVQSAQAWQGWTAGLPTGTAVTLAWLELRPDDRLARMAERGSGRDAALIASGSAPAVPRPVIPHLLVDAGPAPAEVAAALLPSIR